LFSRVTRKTGKTPDNSGEATEQCQGLGAALKRGD